jgi:hypothetical protein
MAELGESVRGLYGEEKALFARREVVLERLQATCTRTGEDALQRSSEGWGGAGAAKRRENALCARRPPRFPCVPSRPIATAVEAGLATSRPHQFKRSPPLLPSHVASFGTRFIRHHASFDDRVAAVIAVVGIRAMMRLGKLVAPSHKDDRDERKDIKRQSVQLDAMSFPFFLPYHRADRRWRGSQVTVVKEVDRPR